MTYYFGPSTIKNNLLPISGNAYDLGSSTVPFRNAYIGTALIFTATSGIIKTDTIDGADNKIVSLNGGGAAADRTRGAFIQCAGNDSSEAGRLQLRSGNISTADIILNAQDDIAFIIDTSNSWRFDSTPGYLSFEQADSKIYSQTIDGSDNYQLGISGGSDILDSRGAFLQLAGNEHGDTGEARLQCGNVSGALLRLIMEHSSSSITFEDATSGVLWSINNSGEIISTLTNATIRSNTIDGSDNKSLFLFGGGGSGAGRGASISLYGNENASKGTVSIATGDSSGSNWSAILNSDGFFRVRINGADWFKVENSGYISHLGTFGGSRNYKQSTTTLSALSGATVTTSGLVPAKCNLIGVIVKVSTAITGATSFNIGDGSDADRFGASIAVALNTTTTNANFTANPGGWSSSAQEVTLTANGSNFTGGAVRVTAFYEDFTAIT